MSILIKYSKQNKIVKLLIPKKSYSKEIIIRCLYWYLADYEIELKESWNYNIVIMKSKNDKYFDTNSFENKIKQDLLDYSLRQIIADETKNIKDLIIAKAFASFE